MNARRSVGLTGAFTVGWLVLAAASAPPLSAAEEPALRSVVVTLANPKGDPVESLAAEEVVVVENGVARIVTRVEPERRPLTVLLLVDSSAAVASAFRLQVVPAVNGFVRGLPAGTSYSVWTTGDRPTRVVEPTTDPNAAERALGRVHPQGGNTLLDALVEAPREDFKKIEGERTAVVVLTGQGVEFSSRDRRQVVEEAQRLAGSFLAVQFQGEEESSFEDRAKYGFVLDELSKKTGGLSETRLSAMGLPSSMSRLAAELRSQYRITYVSVPDQKERKVEVKVAQPGVKVRVGASQPQA